MSNFASTFNPSSSMLLSDTSPPARHHDANTTENGSDESFVPEGQHPEIIPKPKGISPWIHPGYEVVYSSKGNMCLVHYDRDLSEVNTCKESDCVSGFEATLHSGVSRPSQETWPLSPPVIDRPWELLERPWESPPKVIYVDWQNNTDPGLEEEELSDCDTDEARGYLSAPLLRPSENIDDGADADMEDNDGHMSCLYECMWE